MGEVIQFIPRAERERMRLIREARARYDSVFPPSVSVHDQPDKASMPPAVNGANIRRGDVSSRR